MAFGHKNELLLVKRDLILFDDIAAAKLVQC